jgi:nucleotide-binding universal stress UspA family protein
MASGGAGKAPVVIAYDGSPAARQAVVDAAKIVGSCPVLVVTVWEEGLAYVGALAPQADGLSMAAPMVDPEVAREVDHGLHQHAEQVSGEGAALARSLGLDAQQLAMPDEGNVAETILTLVRKRRAVAVVVGSRGLSGIRARLEGSTSKALLKHAPCPVIVVHEADGERD